MRRRRKTGNGPGTKKGKKQGGESVLGTGTTASPSSEETWKGGGGVSSGDIGDMSVTAVDVVDTTTHQHFGHGHTHINSPKSPSPPKQTVKAMSSDFVSTIPNNKAVGARKRKPTQISKIVDKQESDSARDENKDYCASFPHNNNNSPPYKKAHIEAGEKNGMIQNIVTELKSAKKASSSQFRKIHSHATVIAEEEVLSCSSEDEASLQIELQNEEEPKRKRTNKKREGKTDLTNIRTLLTSARRRSESEDAAEGDECEDEGVDMRVVRGEAEESGHQHLPFRCGVCRFGTTDRATLLGHMKTHSGERSFQCRLCCFAFTTKANCERHLRNRHGQIEKDQIRNLVVVFSSSSSNNSDSETEDTGVQNHHYSPTPINRNATSGGLLFQTRDKSGDTGNGLLNLTNGRYEAVSRLAKMEKLPTLGGIPLVTTTDDEQPLDLSMDAVDLSTKNRNDLTCGLRGSLLRPRPIYPTAEMPNLLVTSPFVTKREPIVHPQLALQMFGDEQYNSLFNGCSPFSTSTIRAPDLNGPSAPVTVVPPPFSLFPFGGTPSYNPFSFPTPTMDKVVPGITADVTPNIPPSKTTPTFMAPSPPTSFESRESVTGSLEKEMKLLKSVKKEPKQPTPTESSSASSVSPTTTSRKRPDTKSGEYQKPKQRRYRTERPFSCPHCPARFTLRSNMERHGKHQHPNVWQRSPSNRVINRQQKNQQSPLVGPPTMVHTLKHSNNSSGVEGKAKGRCSSSGVNGDALNNVDVRAVIAQQLKRKLSNSALLNGTVGAESETDSEQNGTEGGRGPDSSDLASVSQLLDRVKNSNIAQYFHDQGTTKSLSNSDDNENDDEDLSGTESQSGSSGDEEEIEDAEDPNDTVNVTKLNEGREKKKSAYSSAPHKISCPHCTRRFPWTSSLRRHLLTHTGQKPYQCPQCPLLFTTKSNCDRHLARKHSGKGKCSGSGYNTTEDDDEEEEGRIHDEEEGGENPGLENHDEEPMTEEVNEPTLPPVTSQRANIQAKAMPTSSPGEDVSFRCHLCEAAASERDVLLAHMEEDHKETYSLLVSKGALTSSPPSETSETEPTPGDPKEVTNRKVMCVFCVRRFWSVEDLRRHIRSHSGERPFSCTHCSRRFTLKHSMLRHLKKHVVDGAATQTPKVRRDPLNKKTVNGTVSKSEEQTEIQETNLIGRLLGIQDEGLVEQLLNKPDAKDAAKILGLRVGLARQNTSLPTPN